MKNNLLFVLPFLAISGCSFINPQDVDDYSHITVFHGDGSHSFLNDAKDTFAWEPILGEKCYIDNKTGKVYYSYLWFTRLNKDKTPQKLNATVANCAK